MKLLIQISDTHFGTEQTPVVESLVRLVFDQSPELIILSGDITQRARRSQFRAAKVFLSRLGKIPVLAIPGNHDIPLFSPAARFLWPYRNYRHEISGDLEPEFETADLLVSALNTTRWYRHIDGEVSEEQVERVARRIECATANQLRIVVAHHPVYVVGPEDKHNLLHGYESAVRRWAQAGADLILGGHIHLPYVGALHESMDGLARRVWAIQAGTATSWRIRYDAGNSVNLIRYRTGLDERCCVVERWDYRTGSQRFELMQSHDLNCE